MGIVPKTLRVGEEAKAQNDRKGQREQRIGQEVERVGNIQRRGGVGESRQQRIGLRRQTARKIWGSKSDTTAVPLLVILLRVVADPKLVPSRPSLVGVECPAPARRRIGWMWMG